MKALIEIPEHQYNRIVELSSISIGRAPYKGIIMSAINAIKQGTPVPDTVSLLSVTEFADKCRECGAKNFIRIPDNATNGDVIKVMFPQYTPRQCGFSIWIADDTKGIEHATDNARFDVDFWDAPYKGGE